MLDLARGLGRRSLEPGDIAQEHFLLRHLPYVSAVGDDVIMLRDGDLMASFAVDGIAAQTVEAAVVSDLAGAVGSIIAQSAPDVAFYLHRFSIARAMAEFG